MLYALMIQECNRVHGVTKRMSSKGRGWSQTVIQYLFLDRAPIDVLEEYYQKPPFHPSLPLLLILIDKGQVRVVLLMIGMFEGRGH